MRNRPSKLLPVAGFAAFLALIAGGIAWRQASMPGGASSANAVGATVGDDGSQANVPGPAPAVATPAPSLTRAEKAARRERFMESMRSARQASSDRIGAASTSLANKYRNERADPQWAGGMETKLQDVSQDAAFAESGLKADSLDIDCKSSTCRIDAGLPSRGNAADWTTVFMSSVGPDIKRAYTSVVAAPDGTTHVVIYAEAR